MLPLQTATSCERLASELRQFQADLSKSKIDTTRTLIQIEKDRMIWLRPNYRVVRLFRKRIEDLKNEILGVHDDVVAVAQCLDDISDIPRSYDAGHAHHPTDQETANRERPIGEVIDTLAQDMETGRQAFAGTSPRAVIDI